jgi:hypothetical protein
MRYKKIKKVLRGSFYRVKAKKFVVKLSLAVLYEKIKG